MHTVVQKLIEHIETLEQKVERTEQLENKTRRKY